MDTMQIAALFPNWRTNLIFVGGWNVAVFIASSLNVMWFLV
jgi:hypothetical protein